MPQVINVPGYGDYEFPDEMGDDEIRDAIDRDIGRPPSSTPYQPKTLDIAAGKPWESEAPLQRRAPTLDAQAGREDTWTEVLGKVPESLASRAGQKVAGVQQNRADWLEKENSLFEARLNVLPQATSDWKNSPNRWSRKIADDPRVIEAANALGVTPEEFAAAPFPSTEELTPEKRQEMVGKFHQDIIRQSRIANSAKEHYARSSELGRQANVNAGDWSAKKLVSEGIPALADVGAAAGAALLTKSPAVGAAVMGANAAPVSYAEARLERGYDRDKAIGYTALMTGAEFAGEVPFLSVLTKSPAGKAAIKKIAGRYANTIGAKVVGAASAEAVGEMLTEALQIGFDRGLYDQDIPLDEALNRIAKAGVLGFGIGGVLSLPHAAVDREAPEAPSAADLDATAEFARRAAPDLTEFANQKRLTGPEQGPDFVVDPEGRVMEPDAEFEPPSPYEPKMPKQLLGPPDYVADEAGVSRRPGEEVPEPLALPAPGRTGQYEVTEEGQARELSQNELNERREARIAENERRATLGLAPLRVPAAPSPAVTKPAVKPATVNREIASQQNTPEYRRRIYQKKVETVKEAISEVVEPSDVQLAKTGDTWTIKVRNKEAASFTSESVAKEVLDEVRRDVVTARRQNPATVLGQKIETPQQPTPAQATAGNYRKPSVRWNGMEIKVENLKGSTRSGKTKEGVEWSREMASDYGYFTGTKSTDGEGVDVYMGPQRAVKTAYVIDQLTPDGTKFDEPKTIIGVKNEAAAKALYMKHFPKGWKGMGAITPMPIDGLKTWLKSGNTQQPLSWQAPKAAKQSKVLNQPEGVHPKSVSTLGKDEPLREEVASPEGVKSKKTMAEKVDQLYGEMEDAPKFQRRKNEKGSVAKEIIDEWSVDPEKIDYGDWPGRVMFHGGTEEAAKSIVNEGVSMDKSHKGYFGKGFYLASQFEVANDLYAQMVDDDQSPSVVAVKIKPTAKILDLRKDADFKMFQKHEKHLGDDDFDKQMVKAGIDGLFDRSFGGVVIYNTDAVEPMKIGDRPLFQMNEKDLIIQHNLSAANLLHADKMGGIAVPSLAVTKKQNAMTAFGEITLLGGKDMVDPRGYARTRVYGGDIYSPRYPQITYKFDKKQLDRLSAMIKPYADKIGSRDFIDGNEIQDGPRELEQNYPFLAMFLDSKGLLPKKLKGTEEFAKGIELRDILRKHELQNEMEEYAAEVFSSLSPAEKLFQGFTYAGNRRYKEHTLDNVVRELKKNLRGGESFNYGVGSLRARYTPQFKSLKQIVDNKDKLVSTKELKSIKEEIDKEFWDIANSLAPLYKSDSNRIGYGDTVISMMQDSANMGLDRALTENQFENVSDDQKKEIRGFLAKLRNFPTEYFEAKITRAVDLSEFSAAVVPSDTTDRVRKVLEKNGISVFEYKRNHEDDRRRAVEKAATETKDALFKRTENQPAKLTERALLAEVTKMISELKVQPGIVVRQSANQLPPELKVAMRKQGVSPSGFSALYWRGSVYAVADNIDSIEDARQTVLHEVVTHFGTDALLTQEAKNEILDGVARENVMAVNRQGQKEYGKTVRGADGKVKSGFDPANQKHRRLAAEEVLAYYGQEYLDGKTLPARIKRWVEKWIATIRDALRRIVGKDQKYDTLFMKKFLQDLQAGLKSGESLDQYRSKDVMAQRRDQTNTAAFKNWFGDSKVVDENGEPLVVYHGTPNDFNEFKVGGDNVRKSGPGIWFTPNKNFQPSAHNTGGRLDIATQSVVGQKTGTNVMPVYLSIKNPLVVDRTTREWAEGVYGGLDFPYLLTEEGVSRIRQDGYDGIINMHDGIVNPSDPVFAGDASKAFEIIAFSPSQIKSAIGNAGTFDPSNPDIRFKLSEKYKVAGEYVDGLAVRADVPNRSSIGASLSEYTELTGLREVLFSDFESPPANTERARKLAKQIENSGEIAPLIVVVDSDGPYILEGSNRYDALQLLGKKSFPAVVVFDESDSKIGVNASWESAASLEAISRVSEESELERDRILIDQNGTVRPLIGVDAVDQTAKPGQIIVQRNIGDSEWTILDRGGMSADSARGKLNGAMEKIETMEYQTPMFQRRDTDIGGMSRESAAPEVGSQINTDPQDFKEQLAKLRREHVEKGGGEYNFHLTNLSDKTLEIMQGAFDTLDPGMVAEQRRGKRKWNATEKAAIDMLQNRFGLTLDSLVNRKIGAAANAETLEAYGKLLVGATKVLSEAAAKAAETNSNDDILKVMMARERLGMIMAPVMGYRTEAGRALNILRKHAREFEEADALWESMGEGTRENIADFAKRVKKAGSIDKVIGLVRASYVPTWWDKFYEYWINGILSGVKTHAVNVFSNIMMNVADLTAHAAAAATSKDVSWKEVWARAGASVHGAMLGLSNAKQAFITEEPVGDATSKFEQGGSRRAIKGMKGRIIRIPGRLLIAEDEFFKSIAYHQSLAGYAMREALKTNPKNAKAEFDKIMGGIMTRRDLIDMARADARRLTFQTPMGPMTASLARTLDKSRVGRLIVPFLRTPTNILKTVAEYSPAAFMLERVRQSFGERADNPADWAIARARIGIGSAVAMGAVMLAMKGLLSGAGPEDDAERQALMLTGWRPYSVKVNGKWYRYNRFDPFGTTMGLAADLFETSQYMTDDEYAKAGIMMLTSIAMNLGEKSYLKGIADFAEAYSDPQRYLEHWARDLGTSLIPNVIAQTARERDPFQRDSRSLIDAVKEKIPGLRETLPERSGLLGDAVKANNFGYFVPLSESAEIDSPIAKAMLKLGVYKRAPDRKIQGFELTPEEYREYSWRVGGARQRYLSEIVEQPSFQKMMTDDPERARELFENRWEAIGNRERQRFIKDTNLMERIREEKRQPKAIGSKYLKEDVTSRVAPMIDGKSKPEAVKAIRDAGYPALAALLADMPVKPRPMVASALREESLS